MFNPVSIIIDAFLNELRAQYFKSFPIEKPHFAEIIQTNGEMALETLANTDAPYHDLTHTIMVTQVGQEILRGRLLCQGDVSPADWLHFVISLLYHDIGYIRGVCKADRGGHYIINQGGDIITPPPGATDAFMTPYHVDRGKIFVQERFGSTPYIDACIIVRNIELTRFPVPDASDYQRLDDYPGLVRSADLIGQMADPQYMQKLSKLFIEFKETGEAKRLGFHNPAELRATYPKFFWDIVQPFIEEGMRFLRKTQAGQQWVANLYNHVFTEEHEEPAFGPERRSKQNQRQGKSSDVTSNRRKTTAYGRRSGDQKPTCKVISARAVGQ